MGTFDFNPIMSFITATLLPSVLYAAVPLIAASIINNVFVKIIYRTDWDYSLKSFLLSVSKTAVRFIALVVIAGNFGFDVTSLVAVLSLAGLALSLSIQGLLNNLFSGVTILVTAPFRTGDLVEVCGQNGTVQQLSLMHTLIVTPDNRLVYLPNGDVAKAPVINFSREGRRRLEFRFTVPASSVPDDVRDTVKSALDGDERILRDPAAFITAASSKGGLSEYIVRFWTSSQDYDSVYYSIAESLSAAFKNLEVEFGF